METRLQKLMLTVNDELQVDNALMPILESLLDPNDQIIVKDKQGRNFKIVFCDYQSSEPE
jgi:hypothetical protein